MTRAAKSAIFLSIASRVRPRLLIANKIRASVIPSLSASKCRFWRMRTRVYCGSRFISSEKYLIPLSLQYFANSARETFNNGRKILTPSRTDSHRIAAKPYRPLPRPRFIKNVSIWSSAWCAVNNASIVFSWQKSVMNLYRALRAAASSPVVGLSSVQ